MLLQCKYFIENVHMIANVKEIIIIIIIIIIINNNNNDNDNDNNNDNRTHSSLPGIKM